MGRSRTKVVLTEEVSRELKRRIKRADSVFERTRLHAVLLATTGEHTLGEIAERVNYARSGVQEFLRRFGDGEFEALLTRGKAPGKASPLQAPALQEAMGEGLRTGRWRTAPQIAAWLEEEHQIQRAPKSIYRWLGKLQGSLEAPRPAHLKKDETQKRRVLSAPVRKPASPGAAKRAPV